MTNADAIEQNAEGDLQTTVSEHAPGAEVGKFGGVDAEGGADFVTKRPGTTACRILVTEEQCEQEPIRISPSVCWLHAPQSMPKGVPFQCSFNRLRF